MLISFFYSKINHDQVPGIVFARGPAVAVLILLESEGETYAVLTEQVDLGPLQYSSMLRKRKWETRGHVNKSMC